MKRFTALFIAAAVFFCLATASNAAESINCWFPPEWQAKGVQAKAITDALTRESGFDIRPRIAANYPQILAAFTANDYNLVYVGSFVQAIIRARGLGTPLVQNINGKELYAGIMVYPRDQDPLIILENQPAQIAYTVGASSGESSAKAATGGKAAMGVANHGAAAAAVKAGKAKAAFVKNWWWDDQKQKFPMLDVYLVPAVSLTKNPDNVLTASKAIPAEMRRKIAAAAVAVKEAFGAPELAPFDETRLEFPLELMKKGGIDPLTYNW